MGDPNSLSWGKGVPAPPVPKPAFTLFDANSVTLATLLGSPIAGAFLMAANYRRLGKAGKAVVAVIIAVLVTILAMVFGQFIPYTFSSVIAIGLLVATRGVAQALQGPDIAQHLRQEGKLASRWIAAGLGVGMMMLTLGSVYLVLYEREIRSYGTKMTFGAKDAVYYSGSATPAEARMVGDKLKSIGYFTAKGVSVFLRKDPGGPVVSFVVKDGSWDRPNEVMAFEDVGAELAPLLHASPLRLRLLNSTREIKKELSAGKAIIGTQDEILYFGKATDADAQSLAQALKTAGYFQDRGFTVLLSKGDGTVLSMVVQEGFWDQPQSVADYQALARQVAPSIGGLPLTLRLVNLNLETKKEIPLQ